MPHEGCHAPGRRPGTAMPRASFPPLFFDWGFAWPILAPGPIRLRMAALAEGASPASWGSRVPGLVGGADDDAGLGMTDGGAEGFTAGPGVGALGALAPGAGAVDVGPGAAGEVGCALSAPAGWSGPRRN